MKLPTLILSAFILVTSCNSKPKITDTSIPSTDTTSKATINEIEPAPAAADNNRPISPRASSEGSKARAAKTGSTSGTRTTSNTSEGTSSTEPVAKKGWSKTAKGAVIGGVVGAGSGAVINKKNRAAGAVIGGVVGAGAGAVIGNEADKKDGRH
ncbi:MAG TPA: YMGG-like glycine zipper-containing protein [Chitinophagaceae bacterium]|nr:YMGG-like glycine zipper-containing protein [Chitinophagaceae bacterium]